MRQGVQDPENPLANFESIVVNIKGDKFACCMNAVLKGMRVGSSASGGLAGLFVWTVEKRGDRCKLKMY